MTMQDWYKAVLALVIWREARGEPREGKIAVAAVIRNRVAATHLPDQWDDIIERKWQFSSMTAPGDGMLVQWPHDGDSSWLESMAVAEGIFVGTILDNTDGSTLYANLKVCSPSWNFSKLTQTAEIGAHTFFKEA
jgi:N-acetylmuramoyl-L-alanine amidase